MDVLASLLESYIACALSCASFRYVGIQLGISFNPWVFVVDDLYGSYIKPYLLINYDHLCTSLENYFADWSLLYKGLSGTLHIFFKALINAFTELSDGDQLYKLLVEYHIYLVFLTVFFIIILSLVIQIDPIIKWFIVLFIIFLIGFYWHLFPAPDRPIHEWSDFELFIYSDYITFIYRGVINFLSHFLILLRFGNIVDHCTSHLGINKDISTVYICMADYLRAIDYFDVVYMKYQAALANYGIGTESDKILESLATIVEDIRTKRHALYLSLEKINISYPGT